MTPTSERWILIVWIDMLSDDVRWTADSNRWGNSRISRVESRMKVWTLGMPSQSGPDPLEAKREDFWKAQEAVRKQNLKQVPQTSSTLHKSDTQKVQHKETDSYSGSNLHRESLPSLTLTARFCFFAFSDCLPSLIIFGPCLGWLRVFGAKVPYRIWVKEQFELLDICHLRWIPDTDAFYSSGIVIQPLCVAAPLRSIGSIGALLMAEFKESQGSDRLC